MMQIASHDQHSTLRKAAGHGALPISNVEAVCAVVPMMKIADNLNPQESARCLNCG